MCFHKKAKGKKLVTPVKASSLRVTPSQSKASLDQSKKKTSSAPAKGPDKPIPLTAQPVSQNSSQEKTCITDKSDQMAISLYKGIKKVKGGSSPAVGSKPADQQQDSPEVFENNAQVVSLNPVNVTQIFVDSVIPQTNVSKQHTDIVDQNTLENVDLNMEDVIYRMDSSEEQFPEIPQPRPLASILEPEDDTILETMSDRRTSRPSEKRTVRPSLARTERRIPTTPERPVSFTPPPPTKSEKVVPTGKRVPGRNPVSTRTAAMARPRPSNGMDSGGAVDNTTPSHDRVTTRTHRPSAPQPATEYRTVVQTTVVQTAMPMEPVDSTLPSREPLLNADNTAKRTPSKMRTAMHKVREP